MSQKETSNHYNELIYVFDLHTIIMAGILIDFLLLRFLKIKINTEDVTMLKKNF